MRSSSKKAGIDLFETRQTPESTAEVANAAFGACGQRCMALSVAVFVGRAAEWIPELGALCAQSLLLPAARHRGEKVNSVSPRFFSV